MPIRYKIDILAALKNAGYSTYKLRQEKIFGERIKRKFKTSKDFKKFLIINRKKI